MWYRGDAEKKPTHEFYLGDAVGRSRTPGRTPLTWRPVPPEPGRRCRFCSTSCTPFQPAAAPTTRGRSEERRVGEEGRSRWAPDHLKKKKVSFGDLVGGRNTSKYAKGSFNIATADVMQRSEARVSVTRRESWRTSVNTFRTPWCSEYER